ncbi:DUF637 domain-containing protein [Pseudoalteromonas luteoviolacea]|uniref:DUF637 domain-containing protein n=1 Tax=Pseudoalteromonas luteoviolacea TaxID=43657 RepID=UPI001B36CAA6|nr:DUF637 domain-containing protein [Pseudoalteromonas luteoviolacea]MBQ4839595.1 DUF637 domain-containing protein [Pseudoalteromonas luteoviolacea]
MKKDNLADKPVPFYKKAIAYLNIFMLLGQVCLPTLAQAYNAFDKTNANQLLASSPAITKVPDNRQTMYVKSKHVVEQPRALNAQTMAGFHQLLLRNKKHALPAPKKIHLAGSSITVIFPSYPLSKQVGDRFVQSRLIRSQIYAELNRNMISTAYADETAQITQLYQNAYELAGKGGVTFGEQVPKSVYDSFGKDFIWPEFRDINGEKVLSPVVHLSASTIETRTVNGHLVEFTGSDVNFRDITVNNGTLLTGRDTYLRTARDLTVNPGAQVASDGDLNLFVGGTLRNHSGNLSARENVKIIAGQYEQKTLVHRFSNEYEQGTRFGQIASVNGENISIYSMGDLVIQGGTVSGNTISLRADGNIRLLSQQTSYVNNQPIGQYSHTSSEIKHLTTKLTAKDSIYLIASGAIELKAAELHADKGVIDLLAGQGVYILNEFNETQSQKSGKWGKTTEEEQEFQTIAIRSALDAGKGVRIASHYGDITLQAAKINAGEGTVIDARNGRVNLLLAKEQDHYFYNKVKKGTWKIKTETKQDTVDTAVYNEIIGGVQVKATQGVTLELGQYNGESVHDVMSQMSQSDSLSWMVDVYNDPQYRCPSFASSTVPDQFSEDAFLAMKQDADFNNCSSTLNVVYSKLEKIHKHDKTSTLSPAAMAIVAIAVSVAMGPAGGLVGQGGTIPAAFKTSAAMGAAMSAGAVTLTTHAVSSLAAGNSINDTLDSMLSDESLKSLAISMATAGVLNSDAFKSFKFFSNADAGSSWYNSELAIDIGNQATQAISESIVKAGISTFINGDGFTEFRDSFKTSLKMYAVNELGEHMAGKIGKAFDPNQNGGQNLDEALKYISHAAVGCMLGVATVQASGNGASKNVSCASGAGGAVIGEYIASELENSEEYKAAKEEARAEFDKFLEDETNNVIRWRDVEKLSPLEIEMRLEQGANKLRIFAELDRLKAKGVDLSKLGAALGAFVAGADANAINIAANAAANSAEFNAFSSYINAKMIRSVIADYLNRLRSNPNGVLGEELGIAAENVYQMGLNLDIARDLEVQAAFNKLPDSIAKRLSEIAISQEEKVAISAAVLAGILDVGSGIATQAEALIRVGMTLNGDSQAAEQNGQLIINSVDGIADLLEQHEEVYAQVLHVIDTVGTDRESRTLSARFVAAAISGGFAGTVTVGAAAPAVLVKLSNILQKLEAKGVDTTRMKELTGIDGIDLRDINNDGVPDAVEVKVLPPPPANLPNNLAVLRTAEVRNTPLDPAAMRAFLRKEGIIKFNRVANKEPIRRSVAIASVVEKDGSVSHFLALSGSPTKKNPWSKEKMDTKPWASGFQHDGKGSPSVTIGGVHYRVITVDNHKVASTYIKKPSQLGDSNDHYQDNWNHAEKKIQGFLVEQYAGHTGKIELAVENTNSAYPGMCKSCNYSKADFANKLSEADITMYDDVYKE